MEVQMTFEKESPSMEALQALFAAHKNWFSGQDDFEEIVSMSLALTKTRAQELATEMLKQDAACAEMIQQRYIAPQYDLEELLQYPKDSLGYIYASSLKEAGFDPDLYSDIDTNSEATYIEARLRQTHDIWHIVTGFGTSTIEEIGLQAFHLAQFPYPLATMLIANVLVTVTLLNPEEIPLLLDTVKRGWEMGKQAELLFPQKWEEGWDKTISQWRSELNIPVKRVAINKNKHQATLTTRKGTVADIPFLARIEYEACLPPMNHCFWDDILQETGTTSLQFIEAMLKANASNWGNTSDFTILEENGKPVAAATGFSPYSDDYRPLCLSRLDKIAEILGWWEKITREFREAYEMMMGNNFQPEFFKPQASWIIETVAVLPEARGRGLGKILLKAVLEEGRNRNYSDAGIMVINGNDRARHTYESLGFKPYQSFYAEYFGFDFSGVTKFRLRY